MGPVLGPIASGILTKNLIKNPKIAKIFRRARKMDKVIKKADEVQKHLNDTKKLYNDEADKLDATAKELEEYRKGLAGDLLKGTDFDDYKKQVGVVQELIEIHKKAAQHLRNQAQHINRDNILKMLAKDFINTSLDKIKDIVINETADELKKVVDPEVLVKFLSSEKGLDDVVGFLVEREMDKMEYDENIKNDKELKDRIMDSIKKQIKEDKEFFKKNWRQKVDELIKKKIEEMEKVVSDVKKEQDKATKKEEEITGGTLSSDQEKLMQNFKDTMEKEKSALLEIHGDDSIFDITDCPSGYFFQRLSGVGCMQINCPSVHDASHFSSTGRCICGSAGSIAYNPDDPNKVCAFPGSYESCPGCVYSCVHSSEKCPLEGVKFSE
jgi:hypothetical protein